MTEPKNAKAVYIIDGARTPFLKARGKMGPFSAADLAVKCSQPLLNRQPFNPTDIDEVIVGCVMQREDEANIGRIVELRAGCGKGTPGWTVHRNCGSGMQALDSARKDIIFGDADLVLAGGTDSMSHAPFVLQPAMVNWLADFQQSKNWRAKIATLFKFNPRFMSPIMALMQGLRDPIVGLNMGQTAEELAFRFNISREEMDLYALRSHQRLIEAQDQGWLSDIAPLFDEQGHSYTFDDGARRDTTVAKLAQLKPFFDRKFGTVTAGNSSQISDGAAMLLLASEKAVKKYDLPILGRIVDVQWAALDPAIMGLGPVMAATPLLQRNNLSLSDIDYWEINEAFAAQVLACVKAWESDQFCRENLGLTKAFGTLDVEKLNVQGGAIAIGHPVGASGARIVLNLLEILKRNQAKRGVAAICIGGGQGGAMLVERNS